MLKRCFRKAVESQLSMEHSGKIGRLEGHVVQNKLFKNHSCTQANLLKKKKKKKKAFFPNAVNCLAAGFHSEEITIRGTCQLHDSRIVCCSLLEHGSSETSAVNLVPIGPNN